MPCLNGEGLSEVSPTGTINAPFPLTSTTFDVIIRSSDDNIKFVAIDSVSTKSKPSTLETLSPNVNPVSPIKKSFDDIVVEFAVKLSAFNCWLSNSVT